MQVSPGFRHRLRDIARAVDPEEACGLVYWRGPLRAPVLTRLVLCPNRAANPLAGFRLTEVDRRAALRVSPPAAVDKVGYFHTHPFAPSLASRADFRGMARVPGLHLISDWDGDWSAYFSRGGEVRSLALLRG